MLGFRKVLFSVFTNNRLLFTRVPLLIFWFNRLFFPELPPELYWILANPESCHFWGIQPSPFPSKFSGRGSCEKVGQWAFVGGRDLGRGLTPSPVLEVRGVTPGKFLKICRCKSVQFSAFWGHQVIKSGTENRPCRIGSAAPVQISSQIWRMPVPLRSIQLLR